MKVGAPVLVCVSVLLLRAQDFTEVKFQHLAKGYRFTEGPAWNVKDQYLVFSDTPSDRIMKWAPSNRLAVRQRPPPAAVGLVEPVRTRARLRRAGADPVQAVTAGRTQDSASRSRSRQLTQLWPSGAST